jgi:hypothetical protein
MDSMGIEGVLNSDGVSAFFVFPIPAPYEARLMLFDGRSPGVKQRRALSYCNYFSIEFEHDHHNAFICHLIF